jgi:predicted XRE-type DNA-binding protein
MKIKILLRYVADPAIKNKIIHRVINNVKLFIGFQIGVAELMEVSQPIVSNVVKFVTGKIIDKAPLWIHFPGALR